MPLTAFAAWLTSTPTLAPYFSSATPFPTLACETAWVNPYPTSTSVPYTPMFETFTPAPTDTPAVTNTPSGPGIYREVVTSSAIELSAIDTDTGAGLSPSAIDEDVVTFNRNSSGPIFAIEFSYSVAYGGSGSATARIDGASGVLFQDAVIWSSSGNPQLQLPIVAIPAWSETNDWLVDGMPGRLAIWGSEAAYNSFISSQFISSVKAFLPDDVGSSVTVGAKLEASTFFNTPSTHTYSLTPVAIWYWGEEIDLSTPTPTPGVGDCSGLGLPTPAPIDLGITLPVPHIGDVNCYVLIPPIEQAIPDFLQDLFGEEELSFAGFQICLRTIYFGDLDLGIVKISLDFIAVVFGGVAIFRWLMRTAT